MKRKQWLALLAALLLLAGCGGGKDAPLPEDPVSVESPDTLPEEQTEVEPEDAEPAETEPAEDEPEQPELVEAEPAEAQPEEDEETEGPQSEEVQPESPQPDADPAPEESDAPAEPEPEPAEAVPEDGTYTASVTLEGGTGRATVESPATLRCEGGRFYAVIVWSSSNYDYMKVDGEMYLNLNAEGNSTFEIPVAAFDQKLDVIGDTVAMSEPHEIEYTLIFDSASLQKQ